MQGAVREAWRVRSTGSRICVCYTRALGDGGFLIEAIREPSAPAERVAARPKALRLRIPNFLMLRALKPA
jgi:hypothetical protein